MIYLFRTMSVSFFLLFRYSISLELIGWLRKYIDTTREKENKSIIFKIKWKKERERETERTNLWRLIESLIQLPPCMRFQVSRIIHYRDNTGGPFSRHRDTWKMCMYCRDNLRHYVLRASLYTYMYCYISDDNDWTMTPRWAQTDWLCK